ncbi:MAG: hypothetical protein NTY12_03380 [Candidatus Falkowbacteria bacterium]|nr:hypothetical protein [Candidatus Falkowbacteria bacterium]
MGYWLTQLTRIFETAIPAMGAHLAIVVSNIFFLGIPVMFALSAYAMVILQVHGLSLLLSVLIALLIVVLASLIFVTAYLKLSADSFTVFSLASVLAFDAILKSWDSLTGGVLGIAGINRPDFASSLGQLALLQFVLTLFIILLEYIILKTQFGRALLAMKENKYIVESFGFSTKRLGAYVIVISSFVAALGGIIAIWRIRFLDPNFGGMMLLIQLATIAIVAAKPKVRWLSWSTIVIVLLPETLRFFSLPPSIVGNLRNLLYSLLLIVIIKGISKTLMPQKRFI